MEGKQSLGDRHRFCVRMKDDLTLKPADEVIPVEKTQPSQVFADLGGTALQTDIRQIGLSEFVLRQDRTIRHTRSSHRERVVGEGCEPSPPAR